MTLSVRRHIATVLVATLVYVARMLSPYPLNRAGGITVTDLRRTDLSQFTAISHVDSQRIVDESDVFYRGLAGAETVAVHPTTADLFAFPARLTSVHGGSNDDGGGWLVRAGQGGIEPLLFVGGRVLGFRFHPHDDNTLIARDAVRGLISIDLRQRKIEILSSVSFCDDLDISATDGTVYFTSATDKHMCINENGLGARGSYCEPDVPMALDLLNGVGAGKLLAYHPRNHSTTTLLSGLLFANGVTLAHNGASVFVSETITGGILRYWLPVSAVDPSQAHAGNAASMTRAPKPAGTVEVFASLGVMVDNIRLSADGGMWVACPALVTWPTVLASRLPPLRWALAHLPPYLWPRPSPYGLIVKLSAEGAIARALHDPSGAVVSGITCVTESADGRTLYLGSLRGAGIPVVKLT